MLFGDTVELLEQNDAREMWLEWRWRCVCVCVCDGVVFHDLNRRQSVPKKAL